MLTAHMRVLAHHLYYWYFKFISQVLEVLLVQCLTAIVQDLMQPLCVCFISAFHEKAFVVFMITSLLYQFSTLILFQWIHPQPMGPEVNTFITSLATNAVAAYFP